MIVPALVRPAFPDYLVPPAAEDEPLAAEAAVDQREQEIPAPEAAPRRRSSEDRLDIVVGESLLEITGEYTSGAWGTLEAREQSEVEHPTDWSAPLEDPVRKPSPPDERDALEITSEAGLDWDSWGFGQNTSDFAAQGEGFVINRHELSPEASEIGAKAASFDEPAPPPPAIDPPPAPRMDERTEVLYQTERAPEVGARATDDDVSELPSAEFTAVAETVAREEDATPPVLSLPSISEFQLTDGVEDAAGGAVAQDPSMSARRLEALKEEEPWARHGGSDGAAIHATRPPDEVASALERIAERIRRGEIVLPDGAPTASDESALSAALAAILRTPGH